VLGEEDIGNGMNRDDAAQIDSLLSLEEESGGIICFSFSGAFALAFF
jgi:hypothetical protein